MKTWHYIVVVAIVLVVVYFATNRDAWNAIKSTAVVPRPPQPGAVGTALWLDRKLANPDPRGYIG